MNRDKLIHMANQIALFFASYPHDEAVAGVTEHIVNFWEGRLRRQLSEHVAAGGTGLHPLVIEASVRIAAPKAAKSAG